MGKSSPGLAASLLLLEGQHLALFQFDIVRVWLRRFFC